jgi:hypothetical protein
MNVEGPVCKKPLIHNLSLQNQDRSLHLNLKSSLEI